MSNMAGVLYRKQELLRFRDNMGSPRVLGGVRVAHFFLISLLCFCFGLLCHVSRTQYCLCLQNSPTVFSRGFQVVHVLLYVSTFLVPCCDVHYNFRIKRCSVHPYPQLFVGGLMFYLCCFIAHSGVMNDLNNRNHKLWNIGSTERHILHMQVLLECCYLLIESSQRDI